MKFSMTVTKISFTDQRTRNQPGSAATDYQDVVFLLALTPQATSTTTLALARPCSR